MMYWVTKGGPVMIPIILLSVVALAFVFEKVIVLWLIRLDIPRFTESVFSLLRKGEFESAVRQCEQVRHPIGRVFKVGILGRQLPRAEAEKRMEREGEEEIHGVERYLGALIVIIGVEPMLGFLGTITGLIRSFMAWERLGNEITVSTLAAGIYQAMITTAAGLIVAIPYYVAYHLIVGRIKHHAFEMNYWGNRLLDLLAEPKEQGRP